jgi:hypothetical protein
VTSAPSWQLVFFSVSHIHTNTTIWKKPSFQRRVCKCFESRSEKHIITEEKRKITLGKRKGNTSIYCFMKKDRNLVHMGVSAPSTFSFLKVLKSQTFMF